MKKYLVYAGMFLGSFLVINVGMYFLLSATQPKSATETAADSLAVDSLAALHGDSTLAGHDTTLLAHSELGGVEEADSTVHQDSTSTPREETPATDHATEVAAEKPVEPVAEQDVEHAAEIADADVPAGDGVAPTPDMPVSSKEIAKLAKMLEGMKPVEAAAIAERLPDETIVQLVLRMKSRAGAKMLAALPVPIAASVAARMAELSGVGG